MVNPFKKKNQQVQSNNSTEKSFSYAKGKVTLSFKLRTDIKTDLQDFAECLEIALEEVNKEIEQ